MTDYITGNTALLGIIGAVSSFIIPMIFGLLAKISKKDLTAQSKKLIVFSISIIVTLAVIISQHKFTGDWKFDVEEIAKIVLINWLAFFGMVNTVYVAVVKYFPGLDQKLEILEKVIKG